jgi:hypothetical protein
MKNIIKFTSLSLMAAALAVSPMASFAQDAATNAPAAAATNAPAATKAKRTILPFHGKIVTLDASAGTFTVGQLNLSVTSTTKITTNSVPATLADFKVGDNVTGAYKKAADGTLNVTTLHLGGKPKKPAPTPATTQ